MHPVSGAEARFAVATIERWYYTARGEKDDPVGVLRRTVRKDCGKVSLTAEQIEHLRQQYEDHKHWTYQLHYDNLAAAVQAKPAMGRLRSYCTVRRYMQAHGLVRKSRPCPQGRPGEVLAAERREKREVRSYEAEYVGSLWHLDFHHSARRSSPPAASGSAPSPWPSSTTTRGSAATCSGTFRRPPRISCMGSPRPSKSEACPARY